MSDIQRKHLVAELARGSFIRASRVMPFPHTYTLVYAQSGFGHDEIPESTVQHFTDARVLAGKPVDALWDTIEYRVVDQPSIEEDALRYWPRGFGWCAKCSAILAADPKGSAPRHGHTAAVKFRRADGSEGVTTPAEPPCEGSGQPLLAVIRPRSERPAHAA